jgi:hypothetical protein
MLLRLRRRRFCSFGASRLVRGSQRSHRSRYFAAPFRAREALFDKRFGVSGHRYIVFPGGAHQVVVTVETTSGREQTADAVVCTVPFYSSKVGAAQSAI